MSPKGLVLVTGANGYIAARTVEAYLNAGYAVRGTVRSAKSAAPLQTVLADFVTQGLLEIVEVPDITIPGAFDEAVKGVTVIAHLASHVSFSNTNVDYVLNTAIKGTTSIVESAGKVAGLKTFVLMSSIGAVRRYNEVATFTEDSWSNSFDIIKETENPPGRLVYLASKVAAEKALWKWVDENKPTFTVTSLNPVYVGGPPLVLPKEPKNENFSVSVLPIWQVFSGQEFPPKEQGLGWGNYVDVRDVARLAVFAAEHPDITDKQRYIIGEAFGTPQAVADILRKAYPERRDIKVGEPGEGYLPGYKIPEGLPIVVAQKAVKATGQDWIPYDQMVLDTAKAFEPLLAAV